MFLTWISTYVKKFLYIDFNMKKRGRHRKPLITIQSTKDILIYTFPSVLMMIFTALYGIADGLLASLYIWTDALSSINIVYPYICLIVALGVMIWIWWSASIWEKLWEGKETEARSSFTQIILTTIIIGIILSIISYFLSWPIVKFLWASEDLYINSFKYLKVISLFSVAALLQQVFQMFFITAWKPKTWLIITIFWWIINIVLWYLFINYFHLWVSWAGLASWIAWSLISIYWIVYFCEKNTPLYFTKFKTKLWELLNILKNWSSEMVTDVSISITTFLFNIIIIKFFWENGVAAATIILYFQLIIYSIYMWLSNWIAPIESYYYWEKNYHALRKLVTHNLKIVLISSCVLTICSYLFGKYFITMLTWENELVYNLALSWSIPFFICFLFAWINIYTSSFFTSVWNDKISAIISIIRSIILTAIFIIIFPEIFWISWIWYSIPAAELLSIIVSYVCFKKYRKTYKL